jgi:nucleoside-diphosphate-sugar epimerase
MKTLFLGASGFVGSNLLSKLNMNLDITILTRDNSKPASLKAKTMHGDIQEKATLQEISKAKFERVIDCSWLGLPDLSSHYNYKNLAMKKSLITNLKNTEVKEFVGLGSCLEYGDLKGSIKENQPGANVGDFGKVKLEILEMIENLNINFKWFRPFYLFGPKQHENSLLISAIRSIEKGIDFSPRDPGKSYDFIDINQATTAMRLVIEQPLCQGIFNIGLGTTKSVNDIVNLVRRSFGMREKEVIKAEGISADTERIKQEAGWRPSETLDESLQKFISEIRVN